MKLKIHALLFPLVFIFCSGLPSKGAAQEPLLGEIRMFAGNFAPDGWALCDGQLLNISSYNALFSLLGTTYGGDGETTFGLPDLRGRVPIHTGDGPGLTARNWGEKGGTETVTAAPVPDPHPAGPKKKVKTVRKGRKKANIVSAPVPAAAHTGGGSDQTNLQPYLGIHFIIALEGIFPVE